MLSDFRLALRHLTKARGFAAIAICTLAVGIGAATAMFSTLRALVVQPFDYPQADRLVHVWSGDRWPLAVPDFLDLQAQSTSFREFGVYTPQSVNVGGDNPQAVTGVNATAGVLRAFGVQPQLGRWLSAEDTVKGAAPVAVISHALWQQSFAGDPAVLDQPIRLNGGDVTLVGVMPASFEFAAPWMRTDTCHVWLPLTLDPEKSDRGSHWLCGIARLHDGVSIETADAEIKTIGQQLSAQYPNTNTHKKFLVRSLYFEMTRDVGSQAWLLFGAVALVLLVACANVASMLLARSAQRQGEFGVRVALGARRSDLVRLALTESFVLALGGALLGLGLAYAGVEVMRVIAPASEARKAAIVLDGPVLLFGLGATALTALLAGVPPALAAMRTTIASVIRSDSRGAVGSRSRHHMLRALIIAQIAVTFILANGAALFSAAYLKLLAENSALATDYVLTAKLNLRGERYETDEQRVRFWERLVERLEPLPGVTAVGLTSKLPLEGGSNTSALVNDEVYDPTQRRMNVERSSVTSGYFDAMGLRIVKGRNLLPSDGEGEYTGVLVNRKLVERAWPDKDPIGEILRANQPSNPWYKSRVVGVVENVRQWGADAEVQPEMYTTPPKHWGNRVYVVIRSTQPADFLGPLLRREVAALDTELSLEDVRTLNQVVRDSTKGQRAVAGLVDFFMATALGLVAVGLYGTLSYHVLQRTPEIGVRMAIGALKGDIVKLVFVQGSRWVAIGVGLGIGGTFGLSSVLKTLVYGMEGLTATPLLVATIMVGAAALAACWMPARRAANLDPLKALRSD
jgi:putative ABC transport system permease protein